MPFPQKLQTFMKEQKWTFAKTMPHEYIVRDQVDQTLFEQLARYIREHGYEGKFYQRTMTYFDEGMVFWTTGAPIEETIIVNRCRKEDSYENHLKAGTLPESKPTYK